MKTIHKLAEEGNFEEVQKLLSKNPKLVNEPDDDGVLPLHYAAYEGHKNIVELLIAYGATVDICTEKASTPMFQAISGGHKDIVEVLLSKGADPNHTTEESGDPPLIEAIIREREEIAQLLVDYGAETNFTPKTGHTPLIIALQKKKPKMALWLIQHGANTATVFEDGTTVLHWAVYAGNADIVNLLIKAGFDVNVQSKSGYTPLYLAGMFGHAELVKTLVASGADPNLTTADKSSPLLIAVKKGHDEAAQALILGGAEVDSLLAVKNADRSVAIALGLGNDRDDSTLLHLAAENGCIGTTELLIDKGADIEARNTKYLTPLYVAFERGKKATVKLLIDKGADIHKRAPKNGVRGGLASTTALHLAANEGWYDISEALLKKGAKVNLKNKLGKTPLHEAAGEGHKDVANLLIANGADIDSLDKDKYTPLNLALLRNNEDIAVFLIDKGADVNIPDHDGVAPLHRAVEENYRSVVELLVCKKANVNARAKNDMTPLHWAAVKGNKDIAEILLRNGAELEVKNGDSWTPLKLAADHGHIHLVDFLKSKGADPDIIENDGRAEEQRNKWKKASWRSDKGELPEVVESRIKEKHQRPIEELFEAINEAPKDQNGRSSVILSESKIQKEAVDLMNADGHEGISVISSKRPYHAHLSTDDSLKLALERYKNLQKEQDEMWRAMRASVMADARLWGYSDNEIEGDDFYPAYDKVVVSWCDSFDDWKKLEYNKMKAMIKRNPTADNIKFLREILFYDEVDFYDHTDLLDFLFSLPSTDWQEDFLKMLDLVDFEIIWKHDFFAILDYGKRFKDKLAVKQLFEKWAGQMAKWIDTKSVPESSSLIGAIFGYRPDETLEHIKETIGGLTFPRLLYHYMLEYPALTVLA